MERKKVFKIGIAYLTLLLVFISLSSYIFAESVNLEAEVEENIEAIKTYSYFNISKEEVYEGEKFQVKLFVKQSSNLPLSDYSWTVDLGQKSKHCVVIYQYNRTDNSGYASADIRCYEKDDYLIDIELDSPHGNNYNLESPQEVVVMQAEAPIINDEPEETIGSTNNISWQSSDICGEYQVQKAQDENFTNDLTTSPWLDRTEYSFANLSNNTEYYYRVRCSSIYGEMSYWSNIVSSYQVNATGEAYLESVEYIEETEEVKVQITADWEDLDRVELLVKKNNEEYQLWGEILEETSLWNIEGYGKYTFKLRFFTKNGVEGESSLIVLEIEESKTPEEESQDDETSKEYEIEETIVKALPAGLASSLENIRFFVLRNIQIVELISLISLGIGSLIYIGLISLYGVPMSILQVFSFLGFTNMSKDFGVVINNQNYKAVVRAKISILNDVGKIIDKTTSNLKGIFPLKKYQQPVKFIVSKRGFKFPAELGNVNSEREKIIYNSPEIIDLDKKEGLLLIPLRPLMKNRQSRGLLDSVMLLFSNIHWGFISLAVLTSAITFYSRGDLVEIITLSLSVFIAIIKLLDYFDKVRRRKL